MCWVGTGSFFKESAYRLHCDFAARVATCVLIHIGPLYCRCRVHIVLIIINTITVVDMELIWSVLGLS